MSTCNRIRRPSALGFMGVLVVFLAACHPAAPTPTPTQTPAATPSLPAEFLGRWYYVGSSGGLAGTGAGDRVAGFIVIGRDNTLDQHGDDGARVSSTTFTVSRGQTIFSTEALWLIHLAHGEVEVITVGDDGATLSLSPDHYDAISRNYARVR
ncbi:MAG: hypothetical protein AB7O52_11235 [Planctomycetota bacterium]